MFVRYFESLNFEIGSILYNRMYMTPTYMYVCELYMHERVMLYILVT